MATPLIHSGARYPIVPHIVVTTRLKSLPRNFAIPKSAIFGVKDASRSMFCGLISQCIMQSRQL
ncbi:hypothetical protein PVAP13_7KG148155 [Panicum virgatum]|uniref:Uncharacterized protein n=1 Tax=Panicum virgatum TaxID=38727 RepID=A0A8T0QGX3_PANVG|nr:hypothetical protein PVAP13_7KG148155 [Panicum virgatum]